MSARVLVIGATGFLGYHVTKALLSRGYAVTAVARRPSPPGLFSPQVTTHALDVSDAQEADLRALCMGHDAIVFGAGADDRQTRPPPAYEYFRKANVDGPARLFRIARESNVKRAVLLSSYFAYFDRAWPDLALAEHHPYIRSRREQGRTCLDICGSALPLAVLELPYIFGAMPGQKPLWTPLINYLKKTPIVFYTRGGSNALSVRAVTDAIVGALERPEATGNFAVGDENLSWPELIQRLLAALGQKKKVLTVPDAFATAGMHLLRVLQRVEGKEGGLDPVEFVKLQTREAYFDPLLAQRALGFVGGDLDEAFRETVRAAHV